MAFDSFRKSLTSSIVACLQAGTGVGTGEQVAEVFICLTVGALFSVIRVLSIDKLGSLRA